MNSVTDPQKYILILEDEEDIRQLIIEELKDGGIGETLLEANNPVEALELYNKYKDNIVALVSDHFMPEENGLEFCKLVKADRPGIRIIMFTANQNFAKENEISMIDYILYKPEGMKLLAYHIKRST